MSKPVGLHRRSGSTNWSQRILIPADLHDTFGRTRVVVSLGTADFAEAKRRSTATKATWDAEFEARRAAIQPVPLQAVTPELTKAIANEAYRFALHADDRIRTVPGWAHFVLTLDQALTRQPWAAAGLLAQTPAHLQESAQGSPYGGLSASQATAIGVQNAARAAAMRTAHARGDVLEALPEARAAMRRLRVLVDLEGSDGRAVLQAVLRSLVLAADALRARDVGDVVDTPSAVDVKASAPGPSTSKMPRSASGVVPFWKQQKARPAKTVSKMELTVAQFETLTAGTELQALTKVDGLAYLAALRETGLAPRTQRSRLQTMQALLSLAVHLEFIPANPLAKLTIDAPRTSKRKVWDADELVTLFADPIYTAYALPTARRAGADASYWLPIMAAFSGARISELAQLAVRDVRHANSVDFLAICADTPPQRLKGPSSARSIPIASELLRLGFLDFVADRKAEGATWLFPLVMQTMTINGAGGEVSKWFGAYKTAKGFPAAKVFHSFRHTVQMALQRAGVLQVRIDRLMGHSPQGSEGVKTYGQHQTLAELRDAIEHIQYAGLVLPRVYQPSKRNPA